jgi:hypothetical protein
MGSTSWRRKLFRLRRPLAAGICFVLLLAGGGCGSRRPVERPVVEPATVNADSLLSLLVGDALPTGWDGKGTLRLKVEGREIPALTLNCDLRDTVEVKGSARPGMFSPVFAFWGDSLGWQLRLPRSRAILTDNDTASSVMTGRRLVRLFWYGFVPGALVGELENRRLYSSGADWIVSGHPRELGEQIYSAEVRIDQATLAVKRWDLRLPGGETLVQVLYQPAVVKPFKGDRSPDLIQFVCPSLQLTGGLKLTKFDDPPEASFKRPPPPEGWDWFEGQRLGDLLEAAFADQ